MVFLPGCTCCACSEECCRTKSYGYFDTVPQGKWYDECPGVGTCQSPGPEGDCAGDVLEGHIVERFCKASTDGLQIRAILRKNSTLDDFGTIAGIDTTEQCGVLGVITADHDITDELVFEDDGAYVLAKVPFRAENSRLGGPFGAAGVVICWCCVDPEDPPPVGEVCPCCAGSPPPDPPNPPNPPDPPSGVCDVPIGEGNTTVVWGQAEFVLGTYEASAHDGPDNTLEFYEHIDGGAGTTSNPYLFVFTRTDITGTTELEQQFIELFCAVDDTVTPPVSRWYVRQTVYCVDGAGYSVDDFTGEIPTYPSASCGNISVGDPVPVGIADLERNAGYPTSVFGATCVPPTPINLELKAPCG